MNLHIYILRIICVWGQKVYSSTGIKLPIVLNVMSFTHNEYFEFNGIQLTIQLYIQLPLEMA